MSITLAILVLTALISYQGLNKNRNIVEKLKHYPYVEHRQKEYYRLLSSGFVHGSMNHLLINGFVLYMFGTAIEYQFSSCLLYTSPSPRDATLSRMPSSA